MMCLCNPPGPHHHTERVSNLGCRRRRWVLYQGGKRLQPLECLFLRSGEQGLHTALTGIHPLHIYPPKPHSHPGHGTNVTPPGPHHHTERVSNLGCRRGRWALYQGGSRLQPLASVARTPLFEVRGARFTHSPYWHTSVTLTLGLCHWEQDVW